MLVVVCTVPEVLGRNQAVERDVATANRQIRNLDEEKSLKLAEISREERGTRVGQVVDGVTRILVHGWEQ